MVKRQNTELSVSEAPVLFWKTAVRVFETYESTIDESKKFVVVHLEAGPHPTIDDAISFTRNHFSSVGMNCYVIAAMATDYNT